MADDLNSIDPLYNNHPRTSWQILGELQLRVGSGFNGTIDQWLMIILNPLNLPDDFVGKIQKSIEQAAAGVLHPDTAGAKLEYLEVVVLAPTEQISQGKIWGFFRIERTSTDTRNENANGHRVDYYIYRDRSSGGHTHSP